MNETIVKNKIDTDLPSGGISQIQAQDLRGVLDTMVDYTTSSVKYLVVNDITERNAIPSIFRIIGNRVNVISDGLTYKLEGGITNSDWKVCSIDCEIVYTYAEISSSSNTKLTIVKNDEIWGDTNTMYLKNNGILTKLITLQESE